MEPHVNWVILPLYIFWLQNGSADELYIWLELKVNHQQHRPYQCRSQ